MRRTLTLVFPFGSGAKARLAALLTVLLLPAGPVPAEQDPQMRPATGLRTSSAQQSRLPHLGGPAERRQPDEALQLLPTPTARPPVTPLPIAITDPELDGAQDLLGAVSPAVVPARTAIDDLVLEGRRRPAPAGRADDFRWPKDAPPSSSTKRSAAAHRQSLAVAGP